MGEGITSVSRLKSPVLTTEQFFKRLPIPVIAGVSACQLAAAAGCQLVAACDIVVAAKGSRFSTPGSNFGLYCSTPGVPLAR